MCQIVDRITKSVLGKKDLEHGNIEDPTRKIGGKVAALASAEVNIPDSFRRHAAHFPSNQGSSHTKEHDRRSGLDTRTCGSTERRYTDKTFYRRAMYSRDPVFLPSLERSLLDDRGPRVQNTKIRDETPHSEYTAMSLEHALEPLSTSGPKNGMFASVFDIRYACVHMHVPVHC